MDCPILGVRQLLELDQVHPIWLTDIFFKADERCYIHTVTKREERQGTGEQKKYWVERTFEVWQARWKPKYPTGETIMVQIWHEVEADAAEILIHFSPQCPIALLLKILDGLILGGLKVAKLLVSEGATEVRERFAITATHRQHTGQSINLIDLREFIQPSRGNGPGK